GAVPSATTSVSFTDPLLGDVTGTQGATVVSTVGGVTAANVASGAILANASTAANTNDAIVRRDGSGNFSASVITADLLGNATTATTATNSLSLGGVLASEFFLHNGTVPMTGDLNLGSNSIVNAGDIAANSFTGGSGAFGTLSSTNGLTVTGNLTSFTAPLAAAPTGLEYSAH